MDIWIFRYVPPDYFEGVWLEEFDGLQEFGEYGFDFIEDSIHIISEEKDINNLLSHEGQIENIKSINNSLSFDYVTDEGVLHFETDSDLPPEKYVYIAKRVLTKGECWDSEIEQNR